MGTIDNSGRPLPYLFEPKITSIEIGYNYNQEIFENDIIILNLSDSNLEEAEFIVRGLKSMRYIDNKMLIIISNIMTWGNTPLKSFTEEELLKYNLVNEEEIPENIDEKIKMNYYFENESNISENEEEENINGEIKEIINDPKMNYKKESNKNMKEEIKEIREENEEENELNEESEKKESNKSIKK